MGFLVLCLSIILTHKITDQMFIKPKIGKTTEFPHKKIKLLSIKSKLYTKINKRILKLLFIVHHFVGETFFGNSDP